MKLTGQIIYEAWTRREHRYEVPPWDEASEKTRALYEAVADELNRDLAEHQTQPLAGQQYKTIKVSFTATGKTLAAVCEYLDNEVTAWLSDHAGLVLISPHIDTLQMDGLIHRSVTMFVECPIDPQPDEELALTLQEAASQQAMEES